jgi:hypothetical protein
MKRMSNIATKKSTISSTDDRCAELVFLSVRQRAQRHGQALDEPAHRHPQASTGRRKDAVHKATTMIAKNHGVIVVEDLRSRR